MSNGLIQYFNSPKHFVAYYAPPHLWVPRYPPLSSRVGYKRTRIADIRHRDSMVGPRPQDAEGILGVIS
ncbi:hypothetical protein CRG98_010872 [Punica granatum]|uniref:Uncharacterized protein n=1 Tax=Punica granatum TaxID=22663 RepID=A0A2I0KJX1_PUNGR|nr:hypothetical protein CRG98_010872 [Punica granatum]